jgi:hypothetical protein
MSDIMRKRIDQQTVIARVPSDAFERAEVEPDGRFAMRFDDYVTVKSSPGTEKCILWLLEHATDPVVSTGRGPAVRTR